MGGGTDDPPRRAVTDLPTLLASPAELGHLTIGVTLAGRFVVEERLGRGGAGAVYAARDKLLGERVALKLLSGVLRDDDLLGRIRAEVRSARRIAHPNVCRVHELHEEGDALFLAMELLAGETLRQRLRRPLALAEALELARQLGAGLAAAHRAGVVHCDVKPENAILVGDRLVVTDFGIARMTDARGGASGVGAGIVEGTPTYMAPEQCRGEAVDARTDVYALAAVVFELFSGRPPFGRLDSGGLRKYLARVLTEPASLPPESPADATPQARAALSAVLQRGLAKHPGDRPDGVEALVAALIAAAGVAPRAPRAAPPGPALSELVTPPRTSLTPSMPTGMPTGSSAATPTAMRARGIRRLVTVAHVRCAAARDDDDEAAERVEALIMAAHAALIDAGGQIVGTSPDGVVAVFGALTALGDEAERAAQAARALTAADACADVRVGLDTGRLLVRSASRASPSVTGEALGQAARLADQAEAGEVRASSRTGRHLARRFALTQVSSGGDAVTVGPRRARAADADRQPLVGREAELDALTRALAGVPGRARAALVLGPPGMGKSRLCAELLEHVRGAARLEVVATSATPERSLVALGVVRALLGEITGLPERAAPDQALEVARKLLGAPAERRRGEPGVPTPTLAGEPTGDRTLAVASALAGALAGVLAERQDPGAPTGAAVRAAFRAAAALRPRLLVVDDAHWADDASLELLEAIARGEAGADLVVLLCARPELLERRPRLAASVGAVVELQPLDVACATALAERHLGEGGEAARALAELGEGNPFFIEELARERLERGVDAQTDPGLPRGAGPSARREPSTTVEDAIQARLDRLPPEERDVLRAAAVLGRLFRRAHLVELLGVPAGVDQALAGLEARGLARPLPPDAVADDRWELRHALVRDVAYGELPAAERRALHGAAAGAVRAHVEAAGGHPALADLVALARYEEGAERTDAAIDAWRRAGEAAARETSYAEAYGAYKRARTLAPSPTAALLGATGEAALQVGELGAAEELLDEAVRRAEAEGPFAVARTLLLRAGVSRQRARWDEGVTLLRRGLAILPDETTDVVLAARLHAALGWIQGYILGDPAGLPATQRAVALLAPTPHRAELGGALKSLGATYMRAGRFRDQLACNRKNLAIGEELGSPPLRAVAHLNLGVNLLDLGEVDEAAEHSIRALALFERMCAAPTVALVKNNLGLARLYQGRLDDAEALVGEALAAGRTMGGAYQVEGELTLARVAAARGDLERARTLAEGAVSRADTEGGRVDRGIARRVLGALRSRAGDHAGATTLLDEAAVLLEGADLAEAARVGAERARAAERRGASPDDVAAAYAGAAKGLERLGAALDLARPPPRARLDLMRA